MVERGAPMWKVNLGFLLALVVVGLSGVGSYDSVQQLLANAHAAGAARRARLMDLRAWADHQQADPTVERLRVLLDAARIDEESESLRQEGAAEESAGRASNIIM